MKGNDHSLHLILAAALSFFFVVAADAADPRTCGNGVLDGDETCESCATDCTIRPCTATEPAFPVQVMFTAPPSETPSSITVRLAYRSDVLSLPGKGADASVRERISGLPTEGFTAVNDLGYAIRVVNTRPGEIGSGPLFTVSFDRCNGAAAPALTDLGCVVEGCGRSAGVLLGCSCSVSLP